MNKREKIISVVAGLAVLVGVVMLLLDAGGGSGAPPTVAPPATAEIRQEIADGLGGLAVSDEQKAGAAAVTRPWLADPFYQRQEATGAAELDKDAPELLFTYTGYLEMGDTRLAIINGQEYHRNEELEIAGYRLRQIYPNRVLIESELRDTPVVIPYQEPEDFR